MQKKKKKDKKFHTQINQTRIDGFKNESINNSTIFKIFLYDQCKDIMGYKEDILEDIALNSQESLDIKYPSNALCQTIATLGKDEIPGNIFIHPYIVSKMINYIDKTNFGKNNVFLKKETATASFAENLENGQFFNGSILKHFVSSKEVEMKYTYIVTNTNKDVNDSFIENDRNGVSITISPFTDPLEIAGKHAHMILNTPSIGRGVYIAGEMLVKKNPDAKGGIDIFINMASGTMFPAWEMFVEDTPNTRDVMLELATKMIQIAAKGSGINIQRGNIRVELDAEPTHKFQSFEFKKPGLLIGVTNEVDKQLHWEDIMEEITGYSGSSENFAHKFGREYESFTMEIKNKIRMAHRISINILQSLIRPRVYSSKLQCEALVGLFLNAERILQILGNQTKNRPAKFNDMAQIIQITKLDTMDKLYKEFMNYSISFEQIRTGQFEKKTMDPHHNILSPHITKHSFIDLTGLELKFNRFSPFEKIVLGKFLSAGNFGAVHQVTSYVKGIGDPPPDDTPLVAKLLLKKVSHLRTSERDIPYMDMFHKHEPPENATLINAYFKSIQGGSNIAELMVMEEMDKPDFQNDIDTICRDVIRDILRIYNKGFIHHDIKPDNIMKKKDGTHILIDMGMIKRAGSPSSQDGSGLYSGYEMNTLEDLSTKIMRNRGTREKLETFLFDIFSLMVTYAEYVENDMFREYAISYTESRDHKLKLIKDLRAANYNNHMERENDSPMMNQVVQEYIELEENLPFLPANEQTEKLTQFRVFLRGLVQ